MKQVECSQLKLKTSNKITNGDRLAKTLINNNKIIIIIIKSLIERCVH